MLRKDETASRDRATAEEMNGRLIAWGHLGDVILAHGQSLRGGPCFPPRLQALAFLLFGWARQRQRLQGTGRLKTQTVSVSWPATHVSFWHGHTVARRLAALQDGWLKMERRA